MSRDLRLTEENKVTKAGATSYEVAEKHIFMSGQQ